MILRPPISTRTDTLFPYTTLFRSDLQLWSATGAVYYDLPTAGRVSPYIGGGGGAVRESIDRVSASYGRSEEHTSELQSLMRHSYAVLCLKKKNNTTAEARTTDTNR